MGPKLLVQKGLCLTFVQHLQQFLALVVVVIVIMAAAAAAAAANVGAAACLNSSARGSEISPELPSAERNNQ